MSWSKRPVRSDFWRSRLHRIQPRPLSAHPDLRLRARVFDSLVRNGVQHNLEWLKEVAANSNRLRITIADVRDRVLVERAVADATEIYHFAAQVAVTTSILDPRLDFEVNLGGTFNVLDAVRRAGHKPFVLFTSTNKVYGDLGLGKPTRQAGRYVYPGHNGVSESQPLDFHSPYGCSKGGADQYVHDFGAHLRYPDGCSSHVLHCRAAAVRHGRPGMGGAFSLFSLAA